MAYFLGIDGGGTHTTAWLADERGRILARAEAGASHPLKVGFETAERELLRAARKALTVAAVDLSSFGVDGRRERKRCGKKLAVDRGHRAATLEAVCAGLAGVGQPQVHRRLYSWLLRSIPARRHLLTSDAAIALCAALSDAPGIVVISGTGSIAYSQDERGQVFRAGGWGIPFDDLGSGYDVGRKAVAAALQDFDGRGRHTILTEQICRALRLQNITQIVPRTLPQQAIAALFPLVLEAARRGDAVARELCWLAGHDLGALAVALIDRMGWRRSAFPVVCAGGVFKSSALIRRCFTDYVCGYARRARVTLLRREPVEGALALARALASHSGQ